MLRACPRSWVDAVNLNRGWMPLTVKCASFYAASVYNNLKYEWPRDIFSLDIGRVFRTLVERTERSHTLVPALSINTNHVVVVQ